ncbi:hypothetical protein K7H91_24435, partial [Martelella mediterranea]|nr:hypothetical protein [Martelella mediterranea]
MDKRLLDEDKVMQLCFVTDNLEKSTAWFADLTGKEPAHIGKSAKADIAQATYMGKPAEITFRLARLTLQCLVRHNRGGNPLNETPETVQANRATSEPDSKVHDGKQY